MHPIRPFVSMLLLFFSLFSASPAFAAEVASSAPAAQEVTTSGLIWSTINFMAIGIGIYWIMVVVPRKTQVDEKRKFVDSLSRNDEVVTTSGLMGKIASIQDDHIVLDVGGNNRLKVLTAHIRPRPEKQQDQGTTGTAAKKNRIAKSRLNSEAASESGSQSVSKKGASKKGNSAD